MRQRYMFSNSNLDARVIWEIVVQNAQWKWFQITASEQQKKKLIQFEHEWIMCIINKMDFFFGWYKIMTGLWI